MQPRQVKERVRDVQNASDVQRFTLVTCILPLLPDKAKITNHLARFMLWWHWHQLLCMRGGVAVFQR